MAQIQIPLTFATYLRNGSPTQNHPGDGSFFVAGAGAEINHAICKPSFSGLPVGSVISAVTLDVYLTNNTATNRTMRVYRVKRAMTYDGASWNNYDTGQAWQTAGGTGANDIEGTETGNKAWTTGDTENQYYSITLDATHIQAMYEGTYTNNGFLFKMDTESNDAVTWDGHAGSNPPRLTITYTAPPDSKGYALFV